mmetsp:Transcript_57833/g.102741  ORF Transcript_57833/g.102741 Transcript_57833/m.102741 type:complete len:217 (+) Transcript_57833:59-709(+)|eukprot:CAMPEP_0197653586 /NCGR_PEP_ID=MMETSP1338-20131121/36252_1 /TAXON_ID=43686 ORGANISM="Pelagodinium beii, Strain RCC1491" /NCGR_SAMPLE_ID=MMETSP1338 /ASSEMBLY_ACC=CAM_ASM_000754 /LENGTH=216 /DNA_ID=CAMNT_0043228759 /DNA_START=59 /DNA_END=709 /DNA_ORIENTATION=-
MTNPAGMAPQAICVNTVTPLFPRPNDYSVKEAEWSDLRGGSRLVRDIQVYPRHIREHGTHQHLHRTAAVKHPLRSMAGRTDMLSTYEHDFGLMTRPKKRGEGPPWEATKYRSVSETPPRISAPPSERSYRSSRGGVGDYYADPDTNRQFASTDSKLQGYQSRGSPMRLSVAGWGDCRWTPKTHPNMVLGMTQKGVQLQQTANLMNLRAPDVPFVTR